MSVLCPICGVKTALSSIVIEDDKAYMVDESTERHGVYKKARVFAITDWDNQQDTKQGIFECQDCYGRFVAKIHKYNDPEWVPVYPISHKQVPQEIPEPIKGEFDEVNLCFAVGAYRASIAMCQIALEALWRDKEVTSLKELYEKGTISKHLFDQADEIRRWGNVAKHEPIPDVVEADDVEQLRTYLEAILDHVYVQPVRLAALKQKRQGLES